MGTEASLTPADAEVPALTGPAASALAPTASAQPSAQARAPEASAQAAQPGAGAAPGAADESISKDAASAPPASAGGKAGEFSGLSRRSQQGVSASVWRHAREQGFAEQASLEPVDLDAAPQAASGLSAASGNDSGRAAPPAPPGPPKPMSVRSRAVLGFFSSFILVQTAVESLGLAVPQMSNPLTQGFMALAWLSAASYAAYALGSFVGGRLVERFGIRAVYRTVLGARALIWTAAAFLFNPHLQAVPIKPLIALFAIDYFAHAIGRVGEHTLQVAWFKDSPVASNRFGTFRDFVEYGTVLAMLGTGLLIAHFGFGVIIYSAPVMFGAAALTTLILKSLPGAAAGAVKKLSLGTGFKGLFADKRLLKLFTGQVLINNFFYVLYYITATAFSVFAAKGNSDFAAEVSSALIGVYGIGAILGTVLMTRISNGIEKKTASLPEAERGRAQTTLLERTTASTLKWSALALMGAWLFIRHTQIGTLIWPIFAVTPALLGIGLTAQMALNQIDTLMKERMPKETASHIVGAARTLVNLSYAASFVLWGLLFDAFKTGAFYFVGAECVLAAAAYLWLARVLRKPQRP